MQHREAQFGDRRPASAHLAMQIEGEQCQRIARVLQTIAEQQRFDGPSCGSSAWALSPLQQPEPEAERETVREGEFAQLVGVGELEDLAVPGIGRTGGAERQRGIHDGFLGKEKTKNRVGR